MFFEYLLLRGLNLLRLLLYNLMDQLAELMAVTSSEAEAESDPFPPTDAPVWILGKDYSALHGKEGHLDKDNSPIGGKGHQLQLAPLIVVVSGYYKL